MAGVPTPSNDHVTRGQGKVIEQFKSKAVMAGLLKAYLGQVQKFEDACWEVINERLKDNAVGKILDIIGKIVGRKRRQGEELDPDFLRGIHGQIRLNLSNGLASDLSAILTLMLPVFNLTDPTQPYTFQHREEYPHQVRFIINEYINFNPANVVSTLQEGALATVRVLLNYTVVPEGETFTLATELTPAETSATLGYGSTTEVTGGKLAAVKVAPGHY